MLRRHLPAARDLQKWRPQFVELRDRILSVKSLKNKDGQLVAASFPDFMTQFATRFSNDDSWQKPATLPSQFKSLPRYVQQAKALDGATPHDIFAAICLYYIDSSYPLPQHSDGRESALRAFLSQAHFLFPSSSQQPNEWLFSNDRHRHGMVTSRKNYSGP